MKIAVLTDCISKVGIETLPIISLLFIKMPCQEHLPIPGANPTGLQTHQLMSLSLNASHEGKSYKFANSPIQKLLSAEILAVAVTRSRFTPEMQSRYSWLLSQTGSASVPRQTQGPPLSDTMDALTAMM
jgi:hypothetical protein